MNNIPNYWRRTRSTYRGLYPCLKHSITGELNCSGKYGEISELNDQMDLVVIKSPRIAKKVAKLVGKRSFKLLEKGDEHVFRTPAFMFLELAKILKIPKNRVIQIKYANSW